MYCPECGRYGRTDDSYSGRLCPECEEMLQDMEDTMREIQGSGSEDIGGHLPVLTDEDSANRRQGADLEDSVNQQEQRNIAAERSARDRRLMRDRIVAAALDKLEARAREYPYQSEYIATYVGYGLNADDVDSLIAEIRAELSPLVK